MYAIKLKNGNLLVPRRAVSEDGVTGDAVIEITNDDPEWEEWLAEAEGRKPHSRTMLALQKEAWDVIYGEEEDHEQ